MKIDSWPGQTEMPLLELLTEPKRLIKDFSYGLQFLPSEFILQKNLNCDRIMIKNLFCELILIENAVRDLYTKFPNPKVSGSGCKVKKCKRRLTHTLCFYGSPDRAWHYCINLKCSFKSKVFFSISCYDTHLLSQYDHLCFSLTDENVMGLSPVSTWNVNSASILLANTSIYYPNTARTFQYQT